MAVTRMQIFCTLIATCLVTASVMFVFVSRANAEDTAAVDGGYYGTEVKKALDYLKSFGGDPKDPASPVSIHAALLKRFEGLNVKIDTFDEAGVHGMNFIHRRDELVLSKSLFIGSPKNSHLTLDPSNASHLSFINNIISTLFHEYLHSINDGLWARICNNTGEMFNGKNHLEWRAHVATATFLTNLTKIKMAEINAWPRKVSVKDMPARIVVLEQFIELAKSVKSTYTSLNESGYGPEIGGEISDTLSEGAKIAGETLKYYKRIVDLRDRLKKGLRKADTKKSTTGNKQKTPPTNGAGAAKTDEDASYDVPEEFARIPISQADLAAATSSVATTLASHSQSEECQASNVAVNDGPLANASNSDAAPSVATSQNTPPLFLDPLDNSAPPTVFVPNIFVALEGGICGPHSAPEFTGGQTIGAATRTVMRSGQSGNSVACFGGGIGTTFGPPGQQTRLSGDFHFINTEGSQTITYQRDLGTANPRDSVVTLEQGNTISVGLKAEQELGGFDCNSGQRQCSFGVSVGAGVTVQERKLTSSFDQSCCGGGKTQLEESRTEIDPYFRVGGFVSVPVPDSGTVVDFNLSGSWAPDHSLSVNGRDGFNQPISDEVKTPGGAAVMFTTTIRIPVSTGTGANGGSSDSFFSSDRRLKRDIRHLSTTKNGIGIYRYRYVGHKAQHIGVMAQEIAQIHPEAVRQHTDGHFMVDYNFIEADHEIGPYLRHFRQQFLRPFRQSFN